jgi:deoxyadenosine/deoxycytidine kinase
MKIGFCGTMSVGKTTLVNALKNIPEFKDYYFATERSKYLRDLGIPLNTDSTLKGQTLFLAERAGELIRENVITDRTVIDVMVFTRLAKSIPYYQSDAFEELASQFIEEYDYIFYVSSAGIEIEDNGVRETDAEYRDLVDFSIKNFLNRYKHRIKHYRELKGSTEERIKVIQETLSVQYV